MTVGQPNFTKINSLSAEHFFGAIPKRGMGTLDELQWRQQDAKQQVEFIKKYTAVPFSQLQNRGKAYYSPPEKKDVPYVDIIRFRRQYVPSRRQERKKRKKEQQNVSKNDTSHLRTAAQLLSKEAVLSLRGHMKKRHFSTPRTLAAKPKRILKKGTTATVMKTAATNMQSKTNKLRKVEPILQKNSWIFQSVDSSIQPFQITEDLTTKRDTVTAKVGSLRVTTAGITLVAQQKSKRIRLASVLRSPLDNTVITSVGTAAEQQELDSKLYAQLKQLLEEQLTKQQHKRLNFAEYEQQGVNEASSDLEWESETDTETDGEKDPKKRKRQRVQKTFGDEFTFMD